MIDAALDGLARAGQFSDPLAWLVVAAFLAGALLEFHSREVARYVSIGAWGLFGLFWLSLIHHFAFVQKSLVEGVGATVAVPASLYVGYLLYRGRDSLFVLSRAVAVMGLIYMPFEAIPLLRRWLVESVTHQTELLMSLLGQDPRVVHGGAVEVADYRDYRNTFYFVADGGHEITYTILIACTGIGSMAIFAGLIAAVRAPLRRKLRALAVSIPVIWGLNLVRNVFIGLSFGQQRAHVFPDFVMTLFGTEDPYLVSYYIADRIVAQSLSVVALVAVTWLVVRELPEVLTVIEDALFIATGTEYDLLGALDLDVEPNPEAGRTVRADGEGR